MEEPKATPFPLPPGCRFYPSEEELLRHYLAGKNAGAGEGARSEPEGDFSDHIGELELYGHDPFELPSNACYAYGGGGRKTHWFCYVGNAAAAAAAAAGGRGSGAKRRAKSGFWRRKGRSKAVVGRGGKGDLGTRTTFVFYLGNSSKTAVKTDWILYEYSPIDRIKASFVLCRIFAKSRPRNTISENGLVSCAEESVAEVRHIGIQHDGDNSSCRKDDYEIDEQIRTEPSPILDLEFPIYIDPDAQVDMDTYVAQHLLAVLEGDYLEYDDLVD